MALAAAPERRGSSAPGGRRFKRQLHGILLMTRLQLSFESLLLQSVRRKFYNEANPSPKGIVGVFLVVSGQDRHAIECFKLLQQVANFNIRISVVAVSDFAPLSKESVGFVKEENHTG